MGIIMKIVQYNGPFKAGDTITIPAEYDCSYIHIGIQIPKRQPIAYTKETAATPDLEIGEMDGGSVSYRVNETGILEFDDLAQNSWRIRFLKDVPKETIIDIMYSTVS